MSEPELPEYVLSNRAYWDAYAPEWVDSGRRAWARAEPTWGVFGVPEATLGVLPDVAGMDVVELGCGTAYVSAWLARRGARVTGIDNSPEQLETARRLQGEFDLEFPLQLGNAETTPFADASFDLAISEYGACLWADPYRWIPEAARILRPGGRLIFLTNGTFYILTVPDEEDVPPTDRLLRPYFGMHRFDWPDTPGVEFHLGYGDWIRVLRRHGFEVEDLIEVRPAENATTRWPSITLEWARRWPCEEIWKARLRS
jgi:SAM-dependent methyltransferase